mmetsp:Transcript_5824/g.16326  ORF Transcript_5824/g.16326 Transcript_5824/m.16326 type:complete len:91 (-) Transcript_5824:366-638(-)
METPSGDNLNRARVDGSQNDAPGARRSKEFQHFSLCACGSLHHDDIRTSSRKLRQLLARLSDNTKEAKSLVEKRMRLLLNVMNNSLESGV